jgi:DUF3078 family protein
MKKITFLFAVLTIYFVSFGQEDTTKLWKTGGILSVNFSQVELSNWAAGGQNSISGNGLVSVFANYAKDNSAWDNTLDLGYGFLKNEGEDQRKSDDKIEFNSKYGIKANEKWFYTALVNFKTQFSEGYNYPNDSIVISNIFAPAYLTYSIGMDYKPSEKLSVYLSPLSGKSTFVKDQDLADAGAFGVEPAVYDTITGLKITDGETVRNELFAGLVKIVYKDEIFKNVSLQSKLELFSNYLENPQNVDVNWENLISLKVNEYISANILIHLIYDDDIDVYDTNADDIPDAPKLQFKEVFGLGFSYKF